MPASRPLIDRFLEKVIPEPNTGCLIWIGAWSKAGYGQIGLGDQVLYAHRVSFELFCGEIPAGMEVCHSCDNTWCVEPDHLFVGTRADNAADAAMKGRMWAPRGESSPRAKLTVDQVLAIRAAIGTTRAIGAQFGVSNRHVSAIKRGEVWRME